MKCNATYINDLKNRITEGDFEALNALYRQFYKRLMMFGSYLSPALGDTSFEDSIQELFLWIAQHPQKLKEINNLETYIFKCFKNNVRRAAHKADNRHKNNQRFSEVKNKDLLEVSPEVRLIESEELDNKSLWIENLLKSLPPKQKEVLYLRYYLNMSYGEISTIMELSDQVVRNYGYRAIQKLKSNVNVKKRRVEL